MAANKRDAKRTNDIRKTGDTKNKKQVPKKRQWLTSFVVALLAIVVPIAIAIQRGRATGDDPAMTALRFVCHAEGGYCHDNLASHERSHRAKQTIPKGTILLKIPRSLQIWDLDALRALPALHHHVHDGNNNNNNRIQHAMTGRPLDGGAYLALYLWQRFDHAPNTTDPLMSYYQILPTNLSHHPTVWSDALLQYRLKLQSHAYAVTRAYRDMILSEYKALVEVEPVLSFESYQRFRILVLSRSFGTGGPSGDDDDEAAGKDTLQQELALYNKTVGVDLTLGCRAMVPILDMYNHHAVASNVNWRYNTADDGAFVIRASQQIDKHQIVYDSYGTYTDAHLFAKFGFQNGDGSAYTDASIATMHRLMDVGLQQQFSYLPYQEDQQYVKLLERQKIGLARYLQFDDGYRECISSSDRVDSIPYQLKQLKLQHILRLAHDPKRWIISMPPRNPSATTPKTHAQEKKSPSFDMTALPDFDASTVISTCRLMVLTEDDYDGKALQVLQEHLMHHQQQDAILVEKQSDSLEYRALLCLARLSGLVLSRFEISDADAISRFANSVSAEPHSPAWTAHQVVVGEVQTLEVLTKVAAAGAHQYASKISGELPTIRRLPCEWDYTKKLAERTSYV